MTPLQPGELSAYLDGELDETRMREVAAMIAAQPALRDELDALSGDDMAWHTAARSASFAPVVRLQPAGAAFSGTTIVAFVGLAIAGAAALRVLDNLALALAVNLVAAALVSLGVFVLARSDMGMPHQAPVAG